MTSTDLKVAKGVFETQTTNAIGKYQSIVSDVTRIGNNARDYSSNDTLLMGVISGQNGIIIETVNNIVSLIGEKKTYICRLFDAEIARLEAEERQARENKYIPKERPELLEK